MAKRLELLIARGPEQGRRFQVGAGGVRLGRSSSNDVQLPDEELSRNHCLFEQSGDEGIRVTDLASANGTFVNGEQLGSEPRELSAGDTLEVGASVIRVVPEGEDVTASSAVNASPVGGIVDLGLGSGTVPDESASGGASPAGGRSRHSRSPFANILWGVAVLLALVAIAVFMYVPRESEKPVARPVVEAPSPQFVSLMYEKIEADSSRIFRYQMEIDQSGTLHVVYDDVPGENRHVDKRTKLSDAALKRIREILETPGFSDLDDEYAGASAADENALASYRIRMVGWNGARDVRVENSTEPDAFRFVREALEAFSRNELGIWAIQYSREKLIELSAQSASSADAKWEEREVEYGNLSSAIRLYREAVFYLETINPKPDGYANLKDRLSRTEAELKRRYEDQRFLADKALNLGDLELAQAELKILCSLVPEKDDPRHAEANAKLVDVENRMKKARAGK